MKSIVLWTSIFWNKFLINSFIYLNKSLNFIAIRKFLNILINFTTSNKQKIDPLIDIHLNVLP